jgi:hypothetical protein
VHLSCESQDGHFLLLNSYVLIAVLDLEMFLNLFYVKGALRLMILLLLHFMLMLRCLLLLTLFFVLLAALVSHRAPPLCTWIKCMQALYHSFCSLLVAEGRLGRMVQIESTDIETVIMVVCASNACISGLSIGVRTCA